MRDLILLVVIDRGTTFVASGVIIDHHENSDTLLPFTIEQAK
jgi:hypothetical protein